MNITAADIERLKRELEEDLEAIQRVELIFAKRSGKKVDDAGTKPSGGEQPHHPTTAPITKPNASDDVQSKPKGTLRNLVMDAVKNAGPSGIRPRDIVVQIEATGYPATKREVLASVVSTCLHRLLQRDHLIEKKADGLYVWK